MTYDEFESAYHKYGKCPGQMRPPKTKLNDKQIKFLYEKHVKKLGEKKEFKKDEEWIEVRSEVFDRDNSSCQLIDKLNSKQLNQISDSLFAQTKIIDPAHVFGKGAYPHMKYDVDNVVCLSRLFHSRIDSYHDPISGDSINETEHEEWWRIIIGESRYRKLKRRALKR